MIKGYLASNFFDLGGKTVTNTLATIIRNYGVELYSPIENGEINDKKNVSPTAIQIWEADIKELKQADILFLYYDGEDAGVMAEEGYFASMLENTSKKGMIIGIYSDCRQHGTGDGHHYINLFAKGGIEKHGTLITSDNWFTIEKEIAKAIKEFKLDNKKMY